MGFRDLGLRVWDQGIRGRRERKTTNGSEPKMTCKEIGFRV